jgi:hypothetical protein
MSGFDEEESDYDPVKDTAEWAEKLLGKSYTFEDGDRIEVVQVKRRDIGPWITYHIYLCPGIPRKLLMTAEEFEVTYGHLFGLRDAETK